MSSDGTTFYSFSYIGDGGFRVRFSFSTEFNFFEFYRSAHFNVNIELVVIQSKFVKFAQFFPFRKLFVTSVLHRGGIRRRIYSKLEKNLFFLFKFSQNWRKHQPNFENRHSTKGKTSHLITFQV